MKNKVEIVGHSVDPRGNELLSVLVTMPRIILSEMNTHRMLSKNTSSSRAIPFNKMVQSIMENPFIPIAWQKSHSGMQGTEYITDEKQLEDILANYDNARNAAINRAEYFTKIGVTKQIANRLLEPFMWTTMLITGSKEGWDNFFELRCPSYHIKTDTGEYNKFKSWKELCKRHYAGPTSMELKDYSLLQKLQHNKGQAEIHIMDLAEKIYDEYQNSVPLQLKENQWHIPMLSAEDKELPIDLQLKYAVGVHANTSYTVIGDGKKLTLPHAIKIHDKCKEEVHSSVFEHCAIVSTEEEYNNSFKGQEKGWFRNYKGFKSYRQVIEE